MKNYIYYLLIFFISLLWSCDIWAAGEVRERIYLQTDKQSYLAGEMAWLKLLTSTDAGKPLSLSKTGYIELVDGKQSRVQVKIDISKGVGQGWMILPSGLPSGYYRLIAYTNYMRNEGPEVFFEKNIVVVNPNQVSSSSSDNNINRVSAPLSKDNTFSLTTQKNLFSARDRVEVMLDNLPSNIHTLSLSVTGNEIVDTEVSGIMQWKTLLNQIDRRPFALKFLPEYEGHIIKGKLVDKNTGKQIYNNTITPFVSFVGDDICLFTGRMDPSGGILFPTIHSTGRKELVSTFAGTGADNCRIDIESPYIEKHREKKLPDFSYRGNHDELQKRYLGLQVQYSYMADTINTFNSVDTYLWQSPSSRYLMDEYTRFATMGEVFIEFIAYTSFKRLGGKRTLAVYRDNAGFLTGSTLVLVDGIPMYDHEVIYNYNPALIKRIDVYLDRFVFGGFIAEGIVSLTTYKNDYPGLKIDERAQINDYEGTQAHRVFYMPVYDKQEFKMRRLPDYRHTLLWEPNLQTENKTSLVVPFYTSDLTGDYTVTVEGLTTDGRPVRATTTIKVE